MHEKTLHKLLDNIAQKHMPDTIDILPALNARMHRQTRTSVVSLFRYPSKAAAALLVCFLCVATTVYAVVLQINDPALHENMVKNLNLSQTIGDRTVTVDWAYADANRIVIAYTMSDESHNLSDNQLTDVQLWDDDGHRFGAVRAFEADQIVPEMLTGNAHFDASVIESNPQSLNLELHVLNEFVFNFTVPFIAGVRVGQQPPVEQAGLDINLEWAIITPSMTRVYVCYDTPDDDLWFPSIRLAFDGQRVAREPGANYPDTLTPYQNGRRCRGNFFLATYDELPEILTLTIDSLRTPTTYGEAQMQRAADVFAEYGIEAEVLRNEAQTTESYLLNFPGPATDPDLFERVWDEALIAAGDPLTGERVDGPWELIVELQ